MSKLISFLLVRNSKRGTRPFRNFLPTIHIRSLWSNSSQCCSLFVFKLSDSQKRLFQPKNRNPQIYSINFITLEKFPLSFLLIADSNTNDYQLQSTVRPIWSKASFLSKEELVIFSRPKGFQALLSILCQKFSALIPSLKVSNNIDLALRKTSGPVI